MFRAWGGRCDPANPSYDAVFTAGVLFFAKGSDRFHRWFCGTKLYQKHLDSFVKERAMTLKTKLCILLPASAMLILAFLMMQNLPGRIVIVCLIIFKYVYFFTKIKTIRSPVSA